MEDNRCSATTNAGHRCKRNSKIGTYCRQHHAMYGHELEEVDEIAEVPEYPEAKAVAKEIIDTKPDCCICLEPIKFDEENKPITAIQLCDGGHFLHHGRCVEGLRDASCPMCRAELKTEMVGQRLLDKYSDAKAVDMAEQRQAEQRATADLIRRMMADRNAPPMPHVHMGENGPVLMVPQRMIPALRQMMGRVDRPANDRRIDGLVDEPNPDNGRDGRAALIRGLAIFAAAGQALFGDDHDDHHDDDDQLPPLEDDEDDSSDEDDRENDFEGSVIWSEAVLRVTDQYRDQLERFGVDLEDFVDQAHMNIHAMYPMFTHNQVMDVIQEGISNYFASL